MHGLSQREICRPMLRRIAMISQFTGTHRFLSNFWYVDIIYNNIVYRTVEHFFQAMKTLVEEERIAIANAPRPGIAKKMSSKKGYIMPDGSLFKITLRPDWEEIKQAVMLLGLRKKFNHPELASKLIYTYPQTLQEGNWWGDEYWGVNLRTGVGENHLGKLLEIVRLFLLNNVPLLQDPDPIL